MSRRTTTDGGMSRRTVLAGGASALALGTLARLPSAQAASPILQMGSASLGSTGYVIIETLSAIINKYSEPKLRTSSMSTAGGAENMALIGEGLLDFGQTTSTDWHLAMNGLAPYRKKVAVNQMFTYMVWSPTPLVREDSALHSFADLAGKRIATGPAGGSATQIYKALFRAAELDDKVKLTHAAWRGSYDAFKQGAVDAVSGIFTLGIPSPVLRELETTVKVRPLITPPEVLARAATENPGVMSFTLTPEKWPTISEPVTSPAFAGVLAAHPRVDAETGYNVAKAVYDNAEAARKVNKLMSNIYPEFATRYLLKGIPVNAGAAQYFKELGVWRDELTIAKG